MTSSDPAEILIDGARVGAASLSAQTIGLGTPSSSMTIVAASNPLKLGVRRTAQLGQALR